VKTSYECPKCSCRKIWRIEQINERPDGTTTMHPTPLALAQEGTMWRGYHSVGHFEVFLCSACGFTEWYADGLSELKPDPKHGIHLIDMTPQAGTAGPER
jgi:predicted nucleic-acid-binding Zn-ribbon protein